MSNGRKHRIHHVNICHFVLSYVRYLRCVRTMTGDELEVPVEPTTTISEIKEMLIEEFPETQA